MRFRFPKLLKFCRFQARSIRPLNSFDQPKECRMDPQQLTIMAHKFQSVLDAETLNERGHHLAFAKRQRLITPFRFGLSVIASMATQQVPSIASLHRDFNALWEAESSYKAFYNQVAKTSCAEFLRTSLCDIMSQLTMKVLGFEAGQAFSEFNRFVLQDGSSFALHDALAHVFPGRFSAVKPAAVELHWASITASATPSCFCTTQKHLNFKRARSSRT